MCARLHYLISHVWNLFKLFELNPLTNEYTLHKENKNERWAKNGVEAEETRGKREREKLGVEKIALGVALHGAFNANTYRIAPIRVFHVCCDNKCNWCFEKHAHADTQRQAGRQAGTPLATFFHFLCAHDLWLILVHPKINHHVWCTQRKIPSNMEYIYIQNTFHTIEMRAML